MHPSVSHATFPHSPVPLPISDIPFLSFRTEQESGKCWCDLYVAWSNTGAYLLTFHVPGVALWAGPNFTKVARLAHPGVQVAQWSKTDRYLVTYSYGQSMPNEPPGNIQVSLSCRVAESMEGHVGGAFVWTIHKDLRPLKPARV